MKFEKKVKSIKRILENKQVNNSDRELQVIFENYLFFDDCLISFSNKKKKMPIMIQAILYTALSEIFCYSGNIDSFTANNAVEMVKRSPFKHSKGYIQAFISWIIKNKKSLWENKNNDSRWTVKYSHPEWMINRWIQLYGAVNAEKMLVYNNTPPKIFISVNLNRITINQFINLLDENKIEYKEKDKGFFQVLSNLSVERIPGYEKGYFWVQDPSSYFLFHFLMPVRGRILDLCASPGGKSFHLFNYYSDNDIYINDVSLKKWEYLKENLVRLNFWDRSKPLISKGEKSCFRGKFDFVWADVPCSGLGVINRKGDIRWRRHEKDISQLASLQKNILEETAPLINKGGYILYSTCTIEPAENEENIEFFLKRFPDFELVMPLGKEKLEEWNLLDGFYYRSYPFKNEMNGAFAAILKRKESLYAV